MKTGLYKSYCALIAADVIFGLNIPVTKFLQGEWMTPAGYTLTRMLFSAAAFWTIGLFAKKEKVPAKDLALIALGGVLGLLLAQFGLVFSLHYTTPANYALICALSPVIVTVLAVPLLKETVGKPQILGICLSVAGAAALILTSGRGPEGLNNLLGIAISAATILSYSLYLLLMRDVSQKYAPVTLMKWMFLFSMILLLPCGGTLGHEKIFSVQATFRAWSGLAFVLIFPSILAFLLTPVALKRVKASTASVFLNLIPVTAYAAAVIMGQETLSWGKVIAAAFVMSGAYFVTRADRAKPNPKNA